MDSQHGSSRQSRPQAATESGSEEFGSAHTQVARLLNYFCRVVDTSMVDSKSQYVRRHHQSFLLVARHACSRLSELEFADLCSLNARAAAAASKLLLQPTQGLLLDSGPVDVVSTLFETLATMIIRCESLDMATHRFFKDLAWSAVSSSGLLSVLQCYVNAALHAIQRLSAVDLPMLQNGQRRKGRQQQLLELAWQQHIAHCAAAAVLIEQLLYLWQMLLSTLLPWVVTSTSCVEAVPAVIRLAGSAWPILNRMYSVILRSSTLSPPALAALQSKLKIIPFGAVGIAACTQLCVRPKSSESVPQLVWHIDSSQQRQAILLADKLPEILLLWLAHQASCLHNSCHGMSTTSAQCLALAGAAAADADSAGQQQRNGQAENSSSSTSTTTTANVPGHHLALFEALGLGFVELDRQQGRIALATPHAAIPAVREVLLRRYLAAQDHSSSSSSSSSGTADTLTQQPEQLSGQQSGQVCVLQQHLVAPAVKVLIEMMMMMQPEDMALQAQAAELIMLLLHVGYAQRAAAASDAAAPAGAWPELPAAVAAGLLQPVVTQLPQAIICCLLQTQPQQQQDMHQQQQDAQLQQQDMQQQQQDMQQQQQDMQQQKGPGSYEMETNRLSLLHHYGSLLLTVCQAVEAKHIAAAVWQSKGNTNLIRLTAIEAVIRAQACHLVPAAWQQQQQQDASPDGSSNLTQLFPGILSYPVDQAPLRLLPFLYKVTASLLANGVRLQGPGGAVGAPAFKFAVTALKVCQLASAAIIVGNYTAAQADGGSATVSASTVADEQRGSLQAQSVQLLGELIDFGTHWCRDAYGSSSNSSGGVTGNSKVACTPVMPLVLLVKALRCWCDIQLGECEMGKKFAAGASAARVTAAAAATAEDKSNAASAALWHPAQLPSALKMVYVEVAVDQVVRGLQLLAAAASAKEVDGEQHWQRSRPSAEQLQQLLVSGEEVQVLIRDVMEEGIRSVASPVSLYISLPTEPRELYTTKYLQMHEALLQFSSAVLAEFPVQYCCNNLTCLNLSKLSEYQLVCGQGCICAGCEVARYCSRECQRQHWQQHKLVCRRLQNGQ